MFNSFKYWFAVVVICCIALPSKGNPVANIFPPFNESIIFSDNNDDDNPKFTLYMSQGFLNIKYNKPNELLNSEIIVYNLLGQEVTRKKLEAVAINQISIPVQNTCYIVRINYSGKVHTQKIIVSAE
jgi:hypothetical protein